MKPEYRVPSMKEIEKIPHNGFNVVSTFSGAGGSCLGYRMAGFKVLYANEFIPAAQETYKANHPDSYLDTRDIREVKADDILEITGLKKGEIDIFDGSPPCASFSTAGKREKGWGQVRKYSDTKQRVDDLFFEYSRLLRDLQPKVFIAENVSGLVKGKAKGYFKMIMQELKSCGYRVKASVLNAKWLGVPQNRERLIFIGVREDLNIEPVFPKPFSYFYTVEDAFKNLPAENEVQAQELRESAKKYIRGWYGVLKEIPKNPSRIIKGSAVKSGSYFNLSRLSFHHPSDTICQRNGEKSASGNCHPIEDRKLTIYELKRICAFPDDFILTGTFEQQWERLGRAVPPLMMKEIAKTVEREILCKIA